MEGQKWIQGKYERMRLGTVKGVGGSGWGGEQ